MSSGETEEPENQPGGDEASFGKAAEYRRLAPPSTVKRSYDFGNRPLSDSHTGGNEGTTVSYHRHPPEGDVDQFERELREEDWATELRRRRQQEHTARRERVAQGQEAVAAGEGATDQSTPASEAPTEEHPREAQAARAVPTEDIKQAEIMAYAEKPWREAALRLQNDGHPLRPEFAKQALDKAREAGQRAGSAEQTRRKDNWEHDSGKAETMAYAEKRLRELAMEIEKAGDTSSVASLLRQRGQELGEAAGIDYEKTKAEIQAALNTLAEGIQKQTTTNLEIENPNSRTIMSDALGLQSEPFYAKEVGGFRSGRILELYYRTNLNPDTIVITRQNIKTGEMVSYNVVHQEAAIETVHHRGQPDSQGPSPELEDEVEEIRNRDQDKAGRPLSGVKEFFDTSAGTNAIYRSVTENGGDFGNLPQRVQRRQKHHRGWRARVADAWSRLSD